MWNYSEKMMDHFRNPRNVGTIDKPDGTATVGSLACGDALTFQFKLGPDGRIADAKFQTFGCAPPQKMHCSVMGREALEAAIKNFKTGENADRNLEDTMLCTCYNVSENEVRRVITENSLTTVEEVTNFTKAGGGCGRCKEKIAAILKELNG